MLFDNQPDWYAELLNFVLQQGEWKTGRNGRTLSTFATARAMIGIEDGKHMPLITQRALPWKWIVKELLWILSGSTNVKDLGVPLWDKWADDTGELGPTYGKQVRRWGATNRDQFSILLDGLRSDPYSRRHILTLWNPEEQRGQTLVPPCQVSMQFYSSDKYGLCLSVNSRSSDAMCGLPFDVASHALLLHIVARALNYPPGYLVVFFNDLHIYEQHLDVAQHLVNIRPRHFPQLNLNLQAGSGLAGIENLTDEDCSLVDYSPHPKIKLEVVA